LPNTLSKLEIELDNRFTHSKNFNAALLNLINILCKIEKPQFINYNGH